MKRRLGFVSNSSSSSFLILGREIDINEVTSKMIKKKKIMVLGYDLSDGQDVFQISSAEILAFMKALNNSYLGHDISILETYVMNNTDEPDIEFDVELFLEKLPKKGKVKLITCWKDYTSSDSLDLLLSRYDKYGDVTKLMQKYLRSEKINKIEKT